jgi:hypothetical protein
MSSMATLSRIRGLLHPRSSALLSVATFVLQQYGQMRWLNSVSSAPEGGVGTKTDTCAADASARRWPMTSELAPRRSAYMGDYSGTSQLSIPPPDAKLAGPQPLDSLPL